MYTSKYSSANMISNPSLAARLCKWHLTLPVKPHATRFSVCSGAEASGLRGRRVRVIFYFFRHWAILLMFKIWSRLCRQISHTSYILLSSRLTLTFLSNDISICVFSPSIQQCSAVSLPVAEFCITLECCVDVFSVYQGWPWLSLLHSFY